MRKAKIRGLKGKGPDNKTLRMSLKILKLLILKKKEDQEMIKRNPNNHGSAILMRKRHKLGNGLRNKRSSMKNVGRQCRKR